MSQSFPKTVHLFGKNLGGVEVFHSQESMFDFSSETQHLSIFLDLNLAWNNHHQNTLNKTIRSLCTDYHIFEKKTKRGNFWKKPGGC